MSYNGSGTFQINTAGQPVVTGTVISSTAFNSLTSDLATGLSTAITKDGQTTVTANIPMANFKITGLGAATAAADAVRFSQLQGGTDKLITVTGTDTLTGTMTPALTAYAAGNLFSFVAANTNTSAVTINIDGVGVKSITKSGTTALVAGDIVANAVVLIEYDGTRFQFVNAASSGNVVGPASSTANAIPTFSGTTGKVLQDNTKVKIVSNNITMDGSTSGTLTVAASAVSGTNTLTFPANTGTAILDYATPAFRNRIINGAMMIDQRNAGTSVTATGTGSFVNTLDRFSYRVTAASKFTVQQNAGSVTPPTGFINYLGVTSSSSYSVSASDFFAMCQLIEGLNVADFGWGTANAVAITLSFKVYSSLTGTFGGSISNNGFARSYPFSYTISSANTWTSISVTIPGDTSGTWLTTNGIGLFVVFGLGVGSTNSGTAGAWVGAQVFAPTGAVSVVGTNAATWYVTGVQLEKGSTATSFDYRPYGTELALCQRYYYAPLNNSGTTASIYSLGFSGDVTSGSSYYGTVALPVTMRIAPTATWVEGTSSSFPATAADVSVVPSRNSLWAIKTANATGVGYYFGNFTCLAEL